MDKSNNTFEWNGLTYIVKPFNLNTLFALYEGISSSMENGKIIRDMFGNTCKALLEGTTQTAKNFLSSGELATSILNSEDVEKAMEFKERLDFFSTSYTERGNALKKSAPDLTELLARKEPKASVLQSPRGMKKGRGHSGWRAE